MKLHFIRRPFAIVIAIASICTSSAHAQTPQNGSSLVFQQSSDARLSLWSEGGGGGAGSGNYTPLTVDFSGPPGIDNQKSPQDAASLNNATGKLILVDALTYGDLKSKVDKSGVIAYISCDPADYGPTYSQPSDVLASVINTLNLNSRDALGAILLFSRSASWCSTTAANPRIFTMTSANDSTSLYYTLTAGSLANQTMWISTSQYRMSGPDIGSTYTSATSPTTTIAMIVLYSVTGVITFLFLLIIILGAVRAHRHPERYGPRNILGFPRQSRARGMARAMLDTIPIIKFGENDSQPKPADGAHDVELAETNRGLEHEATAPTAQQTESKESTRDTVEVPANTPDAMHTAIVPASDLVDTPSNVPGADTVRVEPATAAGASSSDDSVQCPICTEDFVRGEPARHLPCNHNFHPTCIDPWLLNVSSTCPLCRIDLNPPPEGAETTEANGDGFLVTADGRDPLFGRLSALETRRPMYQGPPIRWHLPRFNLRELGQASREERLEALRRLQVEGANRRQAEEGREPVSEADGTARRGRLSRLFHPSRRQSRAVAADQAEVPATHTDGETPTISVHENETPIQDRASGNTDHRR